MRISDWSSDVCSSDLAIDGLKWAEGVGGLKGLVTRSEANLKAMADWVGRTAWVDFLAADPAIRSSTSICLKIVDPWFQGLDDKGRSEEHTSELQSLMRISYAVFCLKKKKRRQTTEATTATHAPLEVR